MSKTKLQKLRYEVSVFSPHGEASVWTHKKPHRSEILEALEAIGISGPHALDLAAEVLCYGEALGSEPHVYIEICKV